MNDYLNPDNVDEQDIDHEPDTDLDNDQYDDSQYEPEGDYDDGSDYDDSDDIDEEEGYVEFDYNGRTERLSDKELSELLSIKAAYEAEQSNPMRKVGEVASQLFTKDDFLRNYISYLNAGHTPEQAREKTYKLYEKESPRNQAPTVSPAEVAKSKKESRKAQRNEILEGIERGELTNRDLLRLEETWAEEDEKELRQSIREELLREIEPEVSAAKHYTQSMKLREVNAHNDTTLTNAFANNSVDIMSLSREEQTKLADVTREVAASLYQGIDFKTTRLTPIQADAVARYALEYFKPAQTQSGRGKPKNAAERIAAEANQRKGMPIAIDRANRKPKNSPKQRTQSTSQMMDKAINNMFKLK